MAVLFTFPTQHKKLCGKFPRFSRAVAIGFLVFACFGINFAFAENENDPDLPRFSTGVSKKDYLEQRGLESALRRGLEVGKPFEVQKRINALLQLDEQERQQRAAAGPNASVTRWTSIGPEPIPNGQTTGVSTAVSGRTISIAVHPTDPNKVYVGTANGGLYRTLDGGVNWKAMMDSAQSLAIGAVTIDPSNPTTVWVGTGEGNGSADSFAGVGLYRILNAESASPTLEGPFFTRIAGCGNPVDNGIAFRGTSITKIAFDPNNSARMFAGNSTGVGGIGVSVGLGGSNGRIGLWLSENPSAASPTFALCSATGTGTQGIKDIVFEPGSSNNMLFHLVDRAAGSVASGVYRSTNAATATGGVSLTATRVINFTGTTNNGELAINKVGATVTVLSAHGTSSGTVQKSIDGGATFAAALPTATGFCGGQCFYDILVGLDPNDANRMYIGGNTTGASTRIFARSSNGTSFAASEAGLHADSHAVAIAPSSTNVIYTGNDGGIYKSTDFGVTWVSLNVAGFNATQFMSLATHPSNSEFMIGGTQDNGTEYKQANGVWTRTDFGDGGFALIDQNATDTTTVRMYHTYFNQAGSLMGYGTTTTPATAFENWAFRGCNGVAGNGISCTATAVRFYAPMALGPGSPINTVYFGADRLYRSADGGTNHVLASQAPIVSNVAIASIAVAANNDNVRAVGLNNGNVWRTINGSSTLVNVTGDIPSFIVSRLAIDKNNNNIAYATLSGFTTAGQGVWKTTNFLAVTPTWAASATGIPSIPINAFVIDPRNSANLYAGTDIGVYRSTDSGANWTAFSTGLPRTPVFDMAFQAATLATGDQTLRIATHGRGIWEFGIKAAPIATTEVATNVTKISATLQGTVNDNQNSTTVDFQYGLTAAYGSTVAATPGTINTGLDTTVTANIAALTPNTTYHFRVRAVSTVGTTFGQDQLFFTNDLGLQVGSVTIAATKPGDFNRVARVKFSQQFGTPPVVIVQPTNEDADPTALRVINITGASFDVLQVEAGGCAGCTGGGGTMTVNWLAALPGSYRLPNIVPEAPLRLGAQPNAPGSGVLVKVGSVSTSANQRSTTAGGFVGWPATSWQPVVYPTGAPVVNFAAAPVVLTTVQSWSAANEGTDLTVAGSATTLVGTPEPWATAVARNVTANGFDVALESSEVDNDDTGAAGFNGAETIGYIAIQAGVSAQLRQNDGPVVGLGTATSTATDACTAVDVLFPTGTPLVAANFRGFAGKQTRAADDGGWLRRCVLSSPLANTARMTVKVDEDDDLDAERTHANAETVGAAIFGGDFITTPIALARLSSSRSGNTINVRFATATEVGHLGYRIWGRTDSQSDWQALHSELMVTANADGMAGHSYQRTVVANQMNEIRIEDVDILGRSRFHPATAVGADVGADAITAPLNWAAIRAANLASPVRTSRGGAASVLAEVSKSGIQRVQFEDMTAAGWPTSIASEMIAVTNNGRAVWRHIACPTTTLEFGPGCSIEWLATASESLYGAVNVYKIASDGSKARAISSGALVDLGDQPRVTNSEIKFAPNRGYTFSAPGNDPWFDARLVANTAPVEVSRSFALPNRADGPVSISIALWGGLDFAGDSDDHSVEILLNGQSLDARRFDGLVEERIVLSLPVSLLQANNTLTVRVLANTGYVADVVLLDGFTVNYPRESIVSNGELSAGTVNTESAVASSDLFGSSFESQMGFKLAGISAASVVWSQAGSRVRRDAVNSDAQLDSNISGFVVSDNSHIATPTLRPAAATEINVSAVDYLIVTHPIFEAELAPLIALQQGRGYSVRVLRTDEIYAARSNYAPSPQAIRGVISQINPRFVLLVGGDSYDYHNYLGVGSQSYIPTFYRPSNPIVRFAATDAMFVDSDNDGVPERALGRIPARTVAELRLALTSITARGNTTASRFLAVAGVSNAAEHFDIHSRSMLSYLRQGQPTDFALVDELGIVQARAKAVAGLSGGSDWINYLGHSSPNRWAAQNLLDTSQLSSISRAGLPAIVSQWGCWNNYFVLPNQDTMAHALMLRPNQLAAAVIGSSSLAEDASHLALGTRFFDLVEDGRLGDAGNVPINTMGEALRAAKQDLMLGAPEHVESNYSISLFGDPAMPLR